MKKRIISLILVVAMAILTLTGCAYDYAKDDMSLYATLTPQDLYDSLHALLIDDDGFGVDEDERDARVLDAIANAILGKTDVTEKLFAGKVGEYDALYFCYYATDADGNIFFANKMNESSPTKIQIDSTPFNDSSSITSDANLTKEFIKALSDGVLSIEDIANYIYNTSAATVVGKGDAVSISYDWKEGENSGSMYNDYFAVSAAEAPDALSAALIGAQVGLILDGEVKVTKNEKEYTYTNVKVESIVKDNSTEKVEDGDVIYVSYTVEFDAVYNEETQKYEVPEGFSVEKLDDNGHYKATVSFKKDIAKADAKDATAEQKTLLGQLVGKNVGTTTSSITVKNQKVGDKTVKIEYKNVKVNCIVNSETEGFEVKYTPYTEKLDDKETNKKTAVNDDGVEVVLNQKELTYHIFPVYYLDVEDTSAEVIIREFYTAVLTKNTEDEDKEYKFETLNDTEYKYKNDKGEEKTLAELVLELQALYTALSTKESALTTPLKNLTDAQSKLAKDDGKSTEETDKLKTALQNKKKDYDTAKSAVDEAQKKVDEKIAEILKCKKGETGFEESLIEDYKDYQYETLENALNSDITKELANKIVDYVYGEASKNVTLTGKLPEKGVKDAYDALVNKYKYTFYEKYCDKNGKETTDSKADGYGTFYSYYNGNYNEFLSVATTGKKNSSKADIEAAIMKEAKATVEDIVVIYALADAIEAKWEGADVYLTKDEKKEIKNTYGLNNSSDLEIEMYYHAAQFDKIMEFLLEEDEDAESNKIEFVNIKYDFNKPQDN